MMAQLLKQNKIYYTDVRRVCFDSNVGVPQGGVLSPLLFNKTLDFILKRDPVIADYIKRGKLIAFADDIAIHLDVGDHGFLERLFKHFEKHGMAANPKKCEYLTASALPELDEYGVWKEQARYLGKTMSFSKPAMRATLRGQLWASAKNWSTTVRNMPIQPGRICAMVVKSVMTFHLVPNFLTGESELGEIALLFYQVMRRAMCLPRTTNLMMLQSLLPLENPMSWFSRLANRLLLKIEQKRPDLNMRFYWKDYPNQRYTS